MSIAAAVTPTAAQSAVQSSDPIEARRQRGLAIAAVTRIVRAKGREERWLVPSQTGRKTYTVNMVGASPTCDCGDLLKTGVWRVSFVDNSGRNVCNRGRDPSIALEGVSPHAHDPATCRQRLRRPLRTIR
jgi:hypothetical protein